ncbi:MAG TPA: hypothetical protein EYH30_08345 [Anaerolineales bacterium]|nr:hypothetical protein [Anaerolineales bacterium]
MDWFSSVDWVGLLSLINAIFNSGIVILSFALLVYILLYNLRSNVARAFCALLACVLVVYFVDLAVAGAPLEPALRWLRLQWVGIAFTPAVYLHFTDALLRTTNDRNRLRAVAVRLAYIWGGLMFVGAVSTDLVAQDGVQEVGASHLRAGPHFWTFFIYFILAVGWGGVNVIKAWRRCLTSTSRRRMTYLALSFAAPAAGVFPYLLITGWPRQLPGAVLWFLLIVGNLAVGVMLLVMAYTVAFFGALTPDRVVKHRFVRFLLRGPIQATVVVMVVIAASRADGFLGLPALRLSLFGVVAAILLIQLGVELAKPVIDRLLYRRDRKEIEWLQSLGNRLLTTTDLHQFLENVLTAMCDLLRTSAAFVAVTDGGRACLEVVCGSLEPEGGELLPEALERIAGGAPPRHLRPHGRFFIWNGYWLLPLHTRSGEAVIGVLGLAARTPKPDLTLEEEEGLESLVGQVEAALEDRLIQQSLFSVLERVIPQIEEIQRRRGVLRYEGPAALAGLVDPVADPEFPRWVRDALSHYWGGPKLTRSPLLSLRVVERASEEHGSPVNALRAVLQRAIEGLRPEGNRSMTAAEWLLYNILELKFLKGYRVRDVAMRLAMSESDLYRKQRIAIEEVARVLAEMERAERVEGTATR